LSSILEKAEEDMPQQAYKVEELLAMRDSVSESAVSIEKFPNEEAIKGERGFALATQAPTPDCSTAPSQPIAAPLLLISFLLFPTAG
jgi:hypothetical protein